jgi:2-keto-4-pentenoate hydratase/2-oxohepta-3-ene-1,7-dioic acid hydratase in catechol pathway
MKFITYSGQGTTGVGLLLDEANFLDLTRAGKALDMRDLIERFTTLRDSIDELAKDDSHTRPLSDVKIEAPINATRRNIFCVGKNYRDHAVEFGKSGFDGGSSGGAEVPDYPIIFSKPGSVIIGPGQVIESRLDPYSSVDYEGELAVVIGRNGRVGDLDPQSFIFGYTVFNDVTSRELQKRHKQWLLGKGIDTFGPLGPAIVTPDELKDFDKLGIRTWVNDEIRQSAVLGDLIFDVGSLIRTVGTSIALQAGDIIATGTPAGVGIGFRPPKYLKPGDRVRVEIDGIGTLENVVA